MPPKPKANLITQSSHQKLQSGVFELCVACPYDQGNPETCPLCQVRKRPLKERYAWVEKLSDHEAEQILIHHKLCLAQKEGCRPKNKF